jgi:3-carboxy-cis,cis-muconate cycloisomerase
VRPSSSTTDGLVDLLFGSTAVDAAVSDVAWLQAMLDVEAALAAAGADAGLIPAAAAAEIAAASHADRFDIEDIGRRSVGAGNPAAPLARALIDAVSEAAQPYVHLGATSQDVVDTALCLMSRDALDLMLDDLGAAATACTDLAAAHRATLMTARTLLQPALPITFGLKAAGWLIAIDEARALLARVRFERLATQLGGAAGTLASLHGAGIDVSRRFAERVGLPEPLLPWHTNRTRVTELAAALGTAIGVLGKVARDITLLAQAEVAEADEGVDPDHGTSSTLPQKRNPVLAVLILAAAERSPGLVGTAFHSMVQEHERATGGWHAEWETVRELLRLAGGACHHAAALLLTLRIDPSRMRVNLAADGGLVMAESLAGRLSEHVARATARALVRRCADESIQGGMTFAGVVAADAEIRRHLTDEEIAAALDPSAYLGSTPALIDRALDAHHAADRRTRDARS